MDNSNVNTDLIRDHVDTFILATLANGDRYGLDILTEIKEKSQELYELKQATLYSCLKRLEKQGFVTSYKGDTSNGAQRVYYSLLDDGRKFLEKDQYEWEYSRTIINGLLSDKNFDKDQTPPFVASDLRPKTKRQPRSEPSAVESAVVNDSQIIVNQVNENVDYAPSADEDTQNQASLEQKPDFKFVSYDGDLKTVIVKKDAVLYQEDVDYRQVLDNVFDVTNTNYYEPPVNPTNFSEFTAQSHSSEISYFEQSLTPSDDKDSEYSLENISKKFQAEGFTVKPYFKKNTTDFYVNKYFYSNKLMLATSLYSFALFAIVLLIMHLVSFKAYSTPWGALFGTLGGFAIVPIACAVTYLINPNKRVLANYNGKKTLAIFSNFLISAFLIIIIIGFIVLGANFTDFSTVVKSVIFPTIFLLLIPVCIVIYSWLYSTNHFHVN